LRVRKEKIQVNLNQITDDNMEFEIKCIDDSRIVGKALKELVEVSNNAFDDFYKKGKIPFYLSAFMKKVDKDLYSLKIPIDEKSLSKNPMFRLWVWRWRKDTLNGLKKWFKDKGIRVECKVI